MSRYLFVFPPLVGHVNPAAGVAAELTRRGHQTAWVVHGAVVGDLLGPEAIVYPAGDGVLYELADHLPEREHLRGLDALQFLWERVLLPLAAAMVDPVRRAVDDFRPDVVVTDQQAFAGGIVAAERGLPWAVSAVSTADLADRSRAMPKIAAWMLRKLDGLYVELGLERLAAEGFDPRYSPHLVLHYSCPELAGATGISGFDGAPLAFVGPVLSRRPDAVPFPWEWLDRHDTKVLVSLGTVSQGIADRFLGDVMAAAAGRPYGVVMVGSAERLPPPPDNVLVRERVPQLDLLPRMAAVLCHAGHNTTVETLAEGLPLVCAPIRDDQPIVASQVVEVGAGVRLNVARATPDDIAAALDRVLHDPSYRSAAARIAGALHAAGGAAAAAGRLERLVPHAPAPAPSRERARRTAGHT